MADALQLGRRGVLDAPVGVNHRVDAAHQSGEAKNVCRQQAQMRVAVFRIRIAFGILSLQKPDGLVDGVQ